MIALTQVFRNKGYDGTSLQDLAQVTGLKKASLYHRFPNGKQEMAESVLDHMDQWVTENIFNILLKEGEGPKIRLKNGLAQIERLYDGGKDSCMLRALSMQSGLELFQELIGKGLTDWIKAFKKLGTSMGLSEQTAEEHAVQSLIDIQGSLVLSKGLQNTDIFKNALKKIETRYS